MWVENRADYAPALWFLSEKAKRVTAAQLWDAQVQAFAPAALGATRSMAT